MTSETAPPIMIVVLAVLLAAAICLLRWRAWRRGRPTPPIRLWALLDIPRRYLINVHGVVVRKPAVARMHIQAAGGLLLSGSCAVLALFGGLWGFIGATAVGLSSTVGLIGALLAFLRRVPHRPAHLSGGFYWALPALLAVANLFFLAVGAGAALGALPAWNSVTGVLVLVGGFVSLLGLGVAAGKGPMRHATAGLLHLAWHPRPERFQGEPSTALRTLDLDAPKLGADRVEDLDWNQLLGFELVRPVRAMRGSLPCICGWPAAQSKKAC